MYTTDDSSFRSYAWRERLRERARSINNIAISLLKKMSTTEEQLELARMLTAIAHEQIERMRDPLKAILCLEAQFQGLGAKNSSIEEAKNRLLLARILNAFTENQDEAKQHLEKAKMLAKEHARYERVKFEINWELARTFQLLSEAGAGAGGGGGSRASTNANEKYKRNEEEAIKNALSDAEKMKNDSIGLVTKDERMEWKVRVVFCFVELGKINLRNENFAMCERAFQNALKVLDECERDLKERGRASLKEDTNRGDFLKEAMKDAEEREGVTRLKLSILLADAERAIMQRAAGEEPSRVSKAMKRAEAVAKDVHALDENAKELFQFSSLRCISKIEEGDVASALKGASDLRKRCDYHKARLDKYLQETTFVERVLIKAKLIEKKSINNNNENNDNDSTSDKKSTFAMINEDAKEWIADRAVIARAEIYLAETSRKSGSTKETAHRLQDVKKMLDEGLEELGISALGLPCPDDGDNDGADVEITDAAAAATSIGNLKRQNQEMKKGEKITATNRIKGDGMDVGDAETSEEEEEEEEEETIAPDTTTRSGRRSTRKTTTTTPKSTKKPSRSNSKPSKKIPATESTKKKRAAKSKEVVVKKLPEEEKEEEEETEQPQKRLWVMKEENLGPRSASEVFPLFTLRCNCNESLASMYLTAGDYKKAVVEANELDATVSTYPITLGSIVAHCEMVRGHALYSMGKFRDAIKAFTKAAERAKTPSLRDIATLCAALGELATGGSKGASKALDLAQPICRRHEDFLQNEEEREKEKNNNKNGEEGEEDEEEANENDGIFRPSLTDRSVALFVSGFAFLERGNQDGAKSRLSSALKLAHAKTKDTQLVAACLRALGSIASERSAANEQQQALDMLQSAFTLSKAQDDLDGQVEALRKLVESHEKKGSEEKEKKTLADYLARKEKQMSDGLNKLKERDCAEKVLLLEKGLRDVQI